MIGEMCGFVLKDRKKKYRA